MSDARERCSECGFDSQRWRVGDAVDHMESLSWWWRHALAGLTEDHLARRPAGDVWSALEYGVHSAFVTAVLRRSLERVLDGDAWTSTDRVNPPRTQASPDDDPLRVPIDRMLDDIERESRDLAAVVRDAGPGWDRAAARPDRPPVDASSVLLHAVHDASHHQMDVGRVLSRLGLGAVGSAGPHVGRVAQVSTSAGGVPKLPVESADVTTQGLAGDHQADGRHHGRPFQAVCLWSTEAVTDLSAAGHGVFAGAVGENLTIEGLEWSTLRPGARLRIDSTLLEVSYPAVPCAKQARWFADGDFTRLAYERNPRWSRWYAWVREPGSVSTGDEVLVV